MEKSHYKGRGEHSVRQLELIIEQLTEELHLLKIEQNQDQKHFKKDEIITNGMFKARVLEESKLINKTGVIYLDYGVFEDVNTNEWELVK